MRTSTSDTLLSIRFMLTLYGTIYPTTRCRKGILFIAFSLDLLLIKTIYFSNSTGFIVFHKWSNNPIAMHIHCIIFIMIINVLRNIIWLALQLV